MLVVTALFSAATVAAVHVQQRREREVSGGGEGGRRAGPEQCGVLSSVRTFLPLSE